MNLLEHLQETGYEPQERRGLRTDDRYELTVSGIGTVRLSVFPGDGHRADIYLLDRHMVCEWDVKLSPDTPDAVILATLRAAEQEIVNRSFQVVTPADGDTR